MKAGTLEYRMMRILRLAEGLGLDGGDGDRIDNVFDQATPAEIVDGFFQSLEYRAHGNRPGRALHGFVGVVSRVQIRKDKYGGFPADLGIGHLGSGYAGVHGSILLKRSFEDQVGSEPIGDLHGLPDFVDIVAPARIACGIGEHGNDRLDPECFCRFG